MVNLFVEFTLNHKLRVAEVYGADVVLSHSGNLCHYVDSQREVENNNDEMLYVLLVRRFEMNVFKTD